MVIESTDRRAGILEATARVVIKIGLAKMSLDDVATQAGVSRATIYRHFSGGRDELLDALVMRELENFVAGLAEAVLEQQNLEDMFVMGLMRGHSQMVENELLHVTWDREPAELAERLGPRSYVLEDAVREFLADQLRRFDHPTDQIDADAEYLQRMVLSYIDNQGSWDLTDEAQVRRLVRAQFLSSVGDYSSR